MTDIQTLTQRDMRKNRKTERQTGRIRDRYTGAEGENDRKTGGVRGTVTQTKRCRLQRQIDRKTGGVRGTVTQTKRCRLERQIDRKTGGDRGTVTQTKRCRLQRQIERQAESEELLHRQRDVGYRDR